MLSFLFLWTLCIPQTGEVSPEVWVQRPTVQQEATSVWRTIHDIAFLEGQGYTVNLPTHAIIDSLIAKSKRGEFGNQDFPAIYQLLEQEVFDPQDYQAAHAKIMEELPQLHGMLKQIESERADWPWEFKLYDSYEVVLTLYGSGGSYDPQIGTITLMTTPEGDFKKYDQPSHTIIHEITHLGIEQTLIQPLKVSHGTTERLVDQFVLLMFGDQLPGYQIQEMGDVRLDDQLRKKGDLKNVPEILKGLE